MNYSKVVEKIKKLLLQGTENTLIAVNIKGEGYGYYYDLITMSFTKISRTSEMYILPLKRTHEGKVSVYIPNYHGGGTIIQVDEDDIVYVGQN